MSGYNDLIKSLEAKVHALEYSIECFYRGGHAPPEIAALCPFHAHKLDEMQAVITELRETVHFAQQFGSH